MDAQKIILQLTNRVDGIKAHINRLKKPGYKIHELDVELIRNKTIEFYDLINELSLIVSKPEKFSTISPKQEIEIKEDTVNVDKHEIKSAPIVNEPVVVEKPVAIVVEKQEEKPIIKEQETVTTEIETKGLEKKPENTIKPNIGSEKPESQQTTYDLFSDTVDNTVVEKLKPKDEESIADKMSRSRIKNIREAIGINDKFLFINSLFNGDLEKYNKILDEFNDLTTRSGVDTYMDEVKVQFRWNQESDAFLRFKEIIDKKFS